MDFKQVIDEVFARLDREEIRYALIGGFAMAMRGVQRATVGPDILLLRQDLERADEIMLARGYQLAFRSDNVSHYRATDTQLGVSMSSTHSGARLSPCLSGPNGWKSGPARHCR